MSTPILAAFALASASVVAPPASAEGRGARWEIAARADVFRSGEGGADTYRIPSVVATKSGALLAFAEARRGSASDTGDIDLVVRRSEDGGASWSEIEVVWDDGANTCGNPCPVVDPATGEVVLLATRNLGVDHEPRIIDGTSKGTRTVWVLRSADDGRTWSAPEEITATAKHPDWTWYATGPGAGIALERGAHRGRLVVPCDHIEDGTKRYLSHVIWSDDHGKTWSLGGSSPSDQVNECEVLERADGTLLLNMRNYDRTKRARQICESADGGATWTAQRFDETLVEPICQASLRRLSWPSKDGSPGLVAFSNPASAGARERMTVRFSEDDGRTWPESLVVHDKGAAYSCLVALPAGEVGLLYEADGYRRIEFARIRRVAAQGASGAPADGTGASGETRATPPSGIRTE
ncbi:MAG: Sialidase precursor [Planctomycetota bacterium]